MATESLHNGLHIIVLSRQEAANVLGLLAAQLADVALSGNQCGAAPQFTIVRPDGSIAFRLCLTLDPKPVEPSSERCASDL